MSAWALSLGSWLVLTAAAMPALQKSRIVALSTTIHENTQIVDSYLAENGLPSPSFDISTPPDLSLPSDIAKAKEAILEAIDELQTLMLGPMGKIFHEYAHTPTNLTSMHAIAKFKMANSFPPNETTTVAKLAKSAGMNEGDCKRVVRHVLSHHLFLEPSPGAIRHSAMTQAIAVVSLLREWMEDTSENMWSSAPRIVSAMEKWLGLDEPTQSAYNLAHRAASPGMQTSWILDNYSWDKYRSVVDVGGSHGVVAAELGQKHPSLKCTVQDLPEVISAVKTDVPNVEFQTYDFFTPQPVKDADLYLFRMIFHNWGDKYCIDILRNLIPALKPKSQIMINDHVIPEPKILSAYKDKNVKTFNLIIEACFNAKETDINDWTQLLKEADERFAIAEVKRPEGNQLQVIDVEWKG
ncbi:S-adenosyl-L-methionine-dependent methyltransferase [Lophiotrema nucula]|uniref:S-adenosyl-L-methionine-dependent methyltransferase n=1 Tax=Lophiotrema nucula TaxID=690887 RepID=A0A6A5ZU98_9PLEO|nr:S-adenosyl-L-methionine-dependent methyltransferase [Lophiotrema nucula]